MNTEILTFLRSKRVCVFSVEMPDGSPHSATVHFAHIDGPLRFIIQTNPKSRKAESLLLKKESRVSLVIGLEEALDGTDITFQINGVVQLLDAEDDLVKVYIDKFPEKKGKWLSDIFLEVNATWWRYTSWGKSGKKPLIISSEIS